MTKIEAVRTFFQANPEATSDAAIAALAEQGFIITKPQLATAKNKIKKAAAKTAGGDKTTRATAKADKPKPRKGKSKNGGKRSRTQRPYPVVPFTEATQIADAIFKIASGERVRRLTLLEKMDRAPNSGPTKQLITNSGKYGITVGSYAAEWLELTPEGKVACDPASDPRTRLSARFALAIATIPPFALLHKEYVGKKLPAHEVMRDVLDASDLVIEDAKECIDIFVVNAKDLGILRTIAGAETLVSLDHAIDNLPAQATPSQAGTERTPTPAQVTGTAWDTTCFLIAPIGDEASEARKHSDLFMEQIIAPAIKELNLTIVRADQIADPGMITTNILQYIRHARLVIADLSMLNPNVFYEMALRHAVRLPMVQLIRKRDRLPFDVNQVNSVVIDDTDIYSLLPQLETYKSQITTLAKRALEDPEHVGNPITVFYADFWK